MKKKDLNELKTKSPDALKKKILDLEKEKVQMQVELKMGKVKNVHSIGKIKKEIAKANMILNLKRIVAKSAEQIKQKEVQNVAS